MNVREAAEKFMSVWDSYDQILNTAIYGLSEEDMYRLKDAYDQDFAEEVADEIVTIAITRVKEEALKALPNGFEPDWAMSWCSYDGSKTIITYGPDWAEGLPEGEEWDDAKERAARYSSEVQEAIKDALEYEKMCRQGLMLGYFEAAKTFAKAAASCEMRFGDDPTYHELKQALGIE